MNKITIREPQWKGMKVGLAEDKLTTHIVEVNITYKRKTDGVRLWPKPLFIHSSIVMRQEPFVVKRTGTKLRMVPIALLREEI